VRDAIEALIAKGFKYQPTRILPLPNVWLGVSVEDQERAEQRIPDLLATPAAVRFLSCEPLLGPVRLDGFLRSKPHDTTLDWVIVGGESGPRSRDFMLSWADRIIGQCRTARVPCFVKQLGAEAYDDLSYVGSSPRYETKDRKGGDMAEWPTALRVREFPT
jgi:protein gp37